MSMLSAQCDELRTMAESVGLAMPQAATLMMDAADTIWELRDDLQRANAAVQDAEHDESMAWDRVRKVESENAKLRELVRNLLRVIPHDVSGVVVGVHGEHPTYYSFADAMRELGVEVDE